jgi:penicillin-binding protein 2D
MKKIYMFIKIFIFLFISFIIINISLYSYAYITPKISLNSANKITIYDNSGEIAIENLNGNKWVKLDNIASFLKEATISVEDKNFYKHQGFDYLRIVKAVINNIASKSINEGASTISQQYVKNLFLDFDKTWERKIEEAFLTFELETHYSKDEILEGYLNTINYGGGNYGIENASNYYFNKSASDLTLAEATLIAGIPKSPSNYNPITNLESAKKRQKVVLQSMVNNKYITKEEMNNVLKEEVILYGKKDNTNLITLNYYKDAVLQELYNIKEISTNMIKTSGLKIYTNLDIDIQTKAENIMKEEMNIDDDLQTAIMVIDPKNGKVLSLIGGTNYNKSEYNRATQAKRQVGSTIKPFLYYSALENGFTSSSTFLSEKTTFNTGNNTTYSPKNYGEIYANKNISLAAAIAFSDNIYSVKTHLFLGENNLVNVLKRSGLNEELDATVSLALGTKEFSMLDYSNAYSTLADEGKYKKSYFITKVTDINDNILYKHNYEEEKTLNSRYVYILNELLTNTYNYSFIDYTSPTMLSIKDMLTNKYAVKSGSTSSDYWAIGYNNDSLVMVWNGYDDNKDLLSSQSKITKRIWARVIEASLENKDTKWYDIPKGITASLVNPVSGEISNDDKSCILYYEKGTEPTITAEEYDYLFNENEKALN